MCEDGTYYNECNENLLYCENSYLIEKCSICGCLEGFECVDEKCVKIIWKEREQENISYIYSGNKRIAEIKNENTYYYHYDNIGSVRKVTDENQEAVLSVDYLPFGEKYFKDGYGSGYEYTGKEFDDSGLNYYGARYYDSSIGRFVTVDPIGSGINWYAYVDNNPLVKVDPNGLKSTKVDLYFAGLNLVEPISDYSEMSITDRYGKKEEENKIIENGVVLDEQQAKQKRFALVHGIHLFPGNVHDDEGYRNIMLAARERGYLTEEFDTFTVGPASVVECSLEQLGVDTVASKRLIEQGYTGDYDYTVRFSGGNILVPGDVGAGFSETPENKIVLTITDPVQLSSFLLFGGKAYDVKFGWGHDKNSDSVSEAGYYYFDHPNLKNGRFVLESTGVILENLGVDRFKHDQIAKWSIKVSKPF